MYLNFVWRRGGEWGGDEMSWEKGGGRKEEGGEEG